MYKVKKRNKVLMIGHLGRCWIWLRENVGDQPVKDLIDAGYKIEKVWKP
jgi:hypothetical protein